MRSPGATSGPECGLGAGSGPECGASFGKIGLSGDFGPRVRFRTAASQKPGAICEALSWDMHSGASHGPADSPHAHRTRGRIWPRTPIFRQLAPHSGPQVASGAVPCRTRGPKSPDLPKLAPHSGPKPALTLFRQLAAYCTVTCCGSFPFWKLAYGIPRYRRAN